MGLLAICLGGIVFIYFRYWRNGKTPTSTFTGSSAGTGSASGIVGLKGGLLPYGSQIDTGILNQQKFKALRAAPGVSITAEELGNQVLFK